MIVSLVVQMILHSGINQSLGGNELKNESISPWNIFFDDDIEDLKFLSLNFVKEDYDKSDAAFTTLKAIVAVVESKRLIKAATRTLTSCKELFKGYKSQNTDDIMVPATAAYICLYLTKDARKRGVYSRDSLTKYTEYLNALKLMIENDKGEFFYRTTEWKIMQANDIKKEEKEGGACRQNEENSSEDL